MERKRSQRRYGRNYRERTLGSKIKDYLRQFLAFMFSNVGIIGLVVAYTIAGAFIFMAIEGNSEDNVVSLVVRMRNETARRLWTQTCCSALNKTEWIHVVSTEMLQYQYSIVDAIHNGFDGSDENKQEYHWSFPGAFLYSLTVITTIGYGNVAPRTQWGKLTTIVYAIAGMPLFLLYLSNIGHILATSFKWTYAYCCMCHACARRRARGPSVHDQAGDPDPEDTHTGTVSDTESSEYDPQAVTVPVTLCLAIMVGYVCGGALLFSRYESWDLLDGSYFCFISLSTIGFGDLVPGDNFGGRGIQLGFILCSMYLMLGMALIAMCFNLMQEEVLAKWRAAVAGARALCGCHGGNV